MRARFPEREEYRRVLLRLLKERGFIKSAERLSNLFELKRVIVEGEEIQYAEVKRYLMDRIELGVEGKRIKKEGPLGLRERIEDIRSGGFTPEGTNLHFIPEDVSKGDLKEILERVLKHEREHGKQKEAKNIVWAVYNEAKGMLKSDPELRKNHKQFLDKLLLYEHSLCERFGRRLKRGQFEKICKWAIRKSLKG